MRTRILHRGRTVVRKDGDRQKVFVGQVGDETIRGVTGEDTPLRSRGAKDAKVTAVEADPQHSVIHIEDSTCVRGSIGVTDCHDALATRVNSCGTEPDTDWTGTAFFEINERATVSKGSAKFVVAFLPKTGH